MKFKSARFGSPSLSVVSAALETGLSRHFASVDVAVTECPDLSVIGSSTPGICGATKLIEFGGEPYAHNPVYRGKNIDIGELLVACEMQSSIFHEDEFLIVTSVLNSMTASGLLPSTRLS